MKELAAIVAGGKGERIRSLSKDVPKPMLSVLGKPLIEHQIEWLKSSGFSEIALCLGYKAEAISSHFGDGRRWGVSLRYQVEKTPRGTAGAVRDLEPEGDVLVVYGDLYVDMDCRKLLEAHRRGGAAATLVLRETDHPLDSDLARVEGDRITGFYRARDGEPHGNLACAAVWVVTPRLLELAPLDKPSDFGRDVFPRALAEGLELHAYLTAEEVLDLGTPERIQAFTRRREARR